MCGDVCSVEMCGVWRCVKVCGVCGEVYVEVCEGVWCVWRCVVCVEMCAVWRCVVCGGV